MYSNGLKCSVYDLCENWKLKGSHDSPENEGNERENNLLSLQSVVLDISCSGEYL